MPRPVFVSSTGREKKSSNPITSWRERRKEAKAQAEEQAAKQISNSTARNENMIVSTLESIDFLHSKLPKEVLEAKKNPNQPCGDLEYAKRAIVQLLTKNPQTSTLDLRSIDKEILTLTNWFKQSVEMGDERAAYASRAALVRAINDIRCKIPVNQPELARLFVQTNTRYLENWTSLVSLCQVADRMEDNIENLKGMVDVKNAEIEANAKELYDILQNDPAKSEAYEQMLEHDTPEERASWTKEQRAMHKMMVENRYQRGELNLENRVLASQEESLEAQKARVEVLYAKVASLPIVSDPNLLNKYQEAIDELFDELARTDVEIDEALRSMDDIEGRVRQLDVSAGSARAREVAAEEAEHMLEEIKRMQQIESGEQKENNGARLKRLGIHSKEEMEILKQEAAEREAEAERIFQEMFCEEVEAEEERELNYN